MHFCLQDYLFVVLAGAWTVALPCRIGAGASAAPFLHRRCWPIDAANRGHHTFLHFEAHLTPILLLLGRNVYVRFSPLEVFNILELSNWHLFPPFHRIIPHLRILGPHGPTLSTSPPPFRRLLRTKLFWRSESLYSESGKPLVWNSLLLEAH